MDIPVEQPRPPSRRRRLIAWIAAAVVIAAVLAGLGIWWFFRDDAPPEVTLDAATAAIDEGTAPSAATDPVTTVGPDGTDAPAEPITTEPITTDAGAAGAPTTAIAGTWTVDTTIGTFSFEESTGTFVGFRVEEELTGIGSTTAVGRTPEVAGTMTVDGSTVTAVSIEANMEAITTNDSRRDDNARRALETDEFPLATFVLTQPIELGVGAAGGEAVQVTSIGDLTIHGTTLPVEVPLEAQLVEGVVVVVGSIEIVFADYGVTVPDAPIVVSAEDHGVVELQLFFTS